MKKTHEERAVRHKTVAAEVGDHKRLNFLSFLAG